MGGRAGKDFEPGSTKYKNYIRSTGGRILLTEENCKPQVGHNYIAIRRNEYPAYIFLRNGLEIGNIYASNEPHDFICYLDFKKRNLLSILKVDEISFSLFSVLLGHSYL